MFDDEIDAPTASDGLYEITYYAGGGRLDVGSVNHSSHMTVGVTSGGFRLAHASVYENPSDEALGEQEPFVTFVRENGLKSPQRMLELTPEQMQAKVANLRKRYDQEDPKYDADWEKNAAHYCYSNIRADDDPGAVCFVPYDLSKKAAEEFQRLFGRLRIEF